MKLSRLRLIDASAMPSRLLTPNEIWWICEHSNSHVYSFHVPRVSSPK